jgi:hypothetical protein
MKIGDLCTAVWSKELLVYLGDGGYVGWYSCMNLATGERSQYRRDQIQAVKKCP